MALIVDYHKIPMPYKSVLGDIVLRDGAPGPDNYPFEGILSHLSVKSRNSVQAVLFESFANVQVDYDFAHRSREDRAQQQQQFYYRNIEEVPYETIVRFAEQTMYKFAWYKRNSAQSFRRSNTGEQRMLRDEETGKSVSETSNSAEEVDFTTEELVTWRRKLPYLLKRMYDKSLQTGFHVISGMVSLTRSLRDNQSSMPRFLLENGIYTMNMKGDIGGRLSDNVGAFQAEFSKWLRGENRFYDAYYEDMTELFYICERLGIDLYYEDVKKYTKEFFDSLVCDYIIKNYRVFLNLGLSAASQPLSPRLRMDIGKMTLDDLDTVEDVVRVAVVGEENPHLSRCVQNTITLFDNSKLCSNKADTYMSREVFYALCQAYLLTFQRMIYPDKLSCCQSGFYMTSPYEHLILDMTKFVPNDSYGMHALVHRSGTVILFDHRYIRTKFAYTEIASLAEHINRYRDYARNNMRLAPLSWREAE